MCGAIKVPPLCMVNFDWFDVVQITKPATEFLHAIVMIAPEVNIFPLPIFKHLHSFSLVFQEVLWALVGGRLIHMAHLQLSTQCSLSLAYYPFMCL